jgi:hypothetical protein
MSPNLIQSNDEIVDEDEIDDSTLNIYSHVDIYQLSTKRIAIQLDLIQVQTLV